MLQKVKSFFLSIKQQIQLKKPLEQSNPKTRICKICFKQIEETTIHSFLNRNVSICHNCLLTFGPVLNEFEFEGVKCLHLYFYNEKIQEVLYQFKGCKDYELNSVFLEYYKNYLNIKFKNYIMVPAPSFKDSDEERGFNHVIEIAKNLNLKMECCVHKIKKVKQADLTSEERKNIKDVLVIDDVNFSGKKILIIDDVFTTGSTIKSMISLIKGKNPKKIRVLVMSKTIDLDKRQAKSGNTFV